MKAKVFPPKLKKGDEIRIIAPSRSLKIFPTIQNEIATKALQEIGLNVSFSKNVYDLDYLNCGTVEGRIADLHDAFSDNGVKAIMTVVGGNNVNQLFQYIDFEIIKSNPKILVGYSDITALLNAITTKTDLVTYYGPHFTTFGMLKGIDYTKNFLQKILFSSSTIEITPSQFWADDPWWENQENRFFHTNQGYQVIQEGSAEGELFGGHLTTFSMLQGTDYFPKINQGILYIEDVLEKNFNIFTLDRYIETFSQVIRFPKLLGILIGRFASQSGVTMENLKELFKRKHKFKNIPIIANVDFGHTTPHCTLPNGGIVQIEATGEKAQIFIIKH